MANLRTNVETMMKDQSAQLEKMESTMRSMQESMERVESGLKAHKKRTRQSMEDSGSRQGRSGGLSIDEQRLVAIGEMELRWRDMGKEYDQAKIDKRDEVLNGLQIEEGTKRQFLREGASRLPGRFY